jgi:hypothetical protein
MLHTFSKLVFRFSSMCILSGTSFFCESCVCIASFHKASFVLIRALGCVVATVNASYLPSSLYTDFLLSLAWSCL